MPFRVSYYWKQQSELEGGWSENFWNNKASMPEVLTVATALRLLFKTAKAVQPWCPKIRISNPDVFRSGRNFRFQGAGPGTGSATFDVDYPTTKWQLKMMSTLSTVTQWYGGVEDRSVVAGFLDRAAVVLSRDFAPVRTHMTNAANGWCLRVLDPAVPSIPILSVDPTTGLVTVGAHNYLTGQQVRVQRVRGLTDANGLWRVIIPPNSTTTFNLAGWVPSTQVFAKSPKASVRLQLYAYQSLSEITVERATSHKVGRPTDLLGGSRKRRRK